VNSCFTEFGLSADSFTLLFILDEHGSMAQKELVERIFSDANTVSAMLQRLETSFLITRKRSVHDGRIRMVEITEKGRTIKNQMWEKSQQIRDGFEQLFQPNEKQAVLDYLSRISKEMNEEAGLHDKS
jgi:DNA-binding MarR family transcriptional regulator